jgi:hypothetical protein
VDFSHGPECNAEEPACNYQICTPDVLLPTTFLHPLQAIRVVPPVTLQRPKTPTRRREREKIPHGSWDQFTWNENLSNNTSIKITHKPDGFVNVLHERKTGKKK